MNKNLKHWAIETALMVFYFLILVFAFLPFYLTTYSYMLGNSYKFDVSKFFVGIIILITSNLTLLNRDGKYNTVYALTLRLFYLLSFVPMLALYSCGDRLSIGMITEPAIFEILLLLCIRYYSTHDSTKGRLNLRVFPVRNADLYVLIFCGIIALVTWALAGFPVVASFSESYEQRMALRQNALPTIINYLYSMVGGALLPYLFTRNLIKKRYFRMIMCLVFGMMLFFVNGMKTWLFLYLFAVAIVFICKRAKSEFGIFLYIELGIILLTLVTLIVSATTEILDFISQVGRVIIIPNNIGFKYIEFFRTNERLYLRESIFRGLFSTPYAGGSDFYINYGVNATLTSSRANNGLYGDAYRNFGMIGIILYPLFIAKVINIIERNCRYESTALRYFIMFILVWGAINTSFFTWLLTGGIIVLYILLKINRANDEKGLPDIVR